MDAAPARPLALARRFTDALTRIRALPAAPDQPLRLEAEHHTTPRPGAVPLPENDAQRRPESDRHPPRDPVTLATRPNWLASLSPPDLQPTGPTAVD